MTLLVADAHCTEATLHSLAHEAAKTSTVYTFNASLSASTMPTPHDTFRRRLQLFITKACVRVCVCVCVCLSVCLLVSVCVCVSKFALVGLT